MNKYDIVIYWSKENEAFIAEVPELPGCLAHGASHEEALKNVSTAIQLMDNFPMNKHYMQLLS